MSPATKPAIPAAKLALYVKLIATNPVIERKGDTNPYTSYNGHMFTHLAPPGVLALRLGPDDLAAFLKRYKTKLFETYGVVKKDWAVVPDSLLAKTAELRPYLERSFAYVKTLKPKGPAAKPPHRGGRPAGAATASSPRRTPARRRR